MSYFCDVAVTCKSAADFKQLAVEQADQVSLSLSFALAGMPEELFQGADPSPDDVVVAFSFMDESGGAEYLLEWSDFASEAEIGLPLLAAERIALLVRFLEGLVWCGACTAMSVALTESYES
jgi:hypothetical protein